MSVSVCVYQTDRVNRSVSCACRLMLLLRYKHSCVQSGLNRITDHSVRHSVCLSVCLCLSVSLSAFNVCVARLWWVDSFPLMSILCQSLYLDKVRSSRWCRWSNTWVVLLFLPSTVSLWVSCQAYSVVRRCTFVATQHIMTFPFCLSHLLSVTRRSHLTLGWFIDGLS